MLPSNSEFESPEQVETGEIIESRELANAGREIIDDFCRDQENQGLKIDQELKLTDADCAEISAMSPEDAIILVLSFMHAAGIKDPDELLREKGIAIQPSLYKST